MEEENSIQEINVEKDNHNHGGFKLSKKNLIIILSAVGAVVIAGVVLLIVLLTKASPLESRLNQIESAFISAVEINKSIEVSDTGVTVYGYTESAVKDGENITVSYAERKLQNDFTFSTTEDTLVVEKSDFRSVSIKEEDITFNQLSGNIATFVIAKDKAPLLFSVDFAPKNDVTVICNFEGKKLKSLSCQFTSLNEMAVVFNYEFDY